MTFKTALLPLALALSVPFATQLHAANATSLSAQFSGGEMISMSQGSANGDMAFATASTSRDGGTYASAWASDYPQGGGSMDFSHTTQLGGNQEIRFQGVSMGNSNYVEMFRD